MTLEQFQMIHLWGANLSEASFILLFDSFFFYSPLPDETNDNVHSEIKGIQKATVSNIQLHFCDIN